MVVPAAKVSQLGLLPQGQPERHRRVVRMVQAMDEAGFGACTVTGSCEAACPFGRAVRTELVEAHRLLSFARA